MNDYDDFGFGESDDEFGGGYNPYLDEEENDMAEDDLPWFREEQEMRRGRELDLVGQQRCSPYRTRFKNSTIKNDPVRTF